MRNMEEVWRELQRLHRSEVCAYWMAQRAAWGREHYDLRKGSRMAKKDSSAKRAQDIFDSYVAQEREKLENRYLDTTNAYDDFAKAARIINPNITTEELDKLYFENYNSQKYRRTARHEEATENMARKVSDYRTIHYFCAKENKQQQPKTHKAWHKAHDKSRHRHRRRCKPCRPSKSRW